MDTRRTAVGILGAGLVLGGCSFASLLGLANLLVLGIIPDTDFATESSEDYGRARLSLGGEGDDGSPLAPALTFIDIVSDDGSEVIIEDSEEHPGFSQGSFVLLVDGSGSMEYTGSDCPYCPADAGRYRVEAARQLATELHACAPEWRISLMEFSSYVTSSDLNKTRVLVDFTQDTQAILSAAELLSSDGGTPIWDSAAAVLGALTGDADEYQPLAAADADSGDTGPTSGEEDAYGRGLVILSDGEDTDSSSTLDALIAQATAAGVPVHVIGLGQASDLSEYSTGAAAVEQLQRLAAETGGYYGAVYGAEDLPTLAGNIAKAHCGGYSDLSVRWSAPPPSGSLVTGSVGIKGTGIGVPFSFRAP